MTRKSACRVAPGDGDLLLLAPDIQAEILFLEVPPGEQPVSERRLRDTVLKSLDWRETA